MNAIEVHDVTKRYRVGVGRARIREGMPPPLDRVVSAMFPRWWRRDTFNALEDLSLTVPKASTLGIVGHNGAGKTTLLKIISGVTEPTAGKVVASGRLAALIDLLVGFNPDLTAIENAYILGAMYEVPRRVMSGRMRQIIEFAEVMEMARTPIKRFSAGMVARLGFAVITALDPDVLLIDEVLSVGDASFQRKCISWLDSYRSDGGTLLFVSHNLALVRNMTDQVLWLEQGKVVEQGATRDVLSKYAAAMERRDIDGRLQRSSLHGLMDTRRQTRWGAGGARLQTVHIDDLDLQNGQIRIAIAYETTAMDEGIFCVGFVDEGGQEIGVSASSKVPLVQAGGSISCLIQPVPFRRGIYFPVVAILSSEGVVQDRWKLERAVVVDGPGDLSSIEDFGPTRIPGSWSN